ncbi:MAG: hypothetical protein RI897_3111 [Verrucomicrobiota bacterium]
MEFQGYRVPGAGRGESERGDMGDGRWDIGDGISEIVDCSREQGCWLMVPGFQVGWGNEKRRRFVGGALRRVG